MQNCLKSFRSVLFVVVGIEKGVTGCAFVVSPEKKCCCGCGKKARFGHKFVHGHNNAGKRMANTSRTLKSLYRRGLRKPIIFKGPYHTPHFERKVFAALRKIFQGCRHQFPVPGTRYVADIFIPKYKLIVEVDGHWSHYKVPRIVRNGKRRDKTLRSLGYRVLHLRKNLIGRLQLCLDKIKEFIG